MRLLDRVKGWLPTKESPEQDGMRCIDCHRLLKTGYDSTRGRGPQCGPHYRKEWREVYPDDEPPELEDGYA